MKSLVVSNLVLLVALIFATSIFGNGEYIKMAENQNTGQVQTQNETSVAESSAQNNGTEMKQHEAMQIDRMLMLGDESTGIPFGQIRDKVQAMNDAAKEDQTNLDLALIANGQAESDRPLNDNPTVNAVLKANGMTSFAPIPQTADQQRQEAVNLLEQRLIGNKTETAEAQGSGQSEASDPSANPVADKPGSEQPDRVQVNQKSPESGGGKTGTNQK